MHGGRDCQLRQLKAGRRGPDPAVGPMLIHCVPPANEVCQQSPGASIRQFIHAMELSRLVH
jgi:hypothetical protein